MQLLGLIDRRLCFNQKVVQEWYKFYGSLAGRGESFLIMATSFFQKIIGLLDLRWDKAPVLVHRLSRTCASKSAGPVGACPRFTGSHHKGVIFSKQLCAAFMYPFHYLNYGGNRFDLTQGGVEGTQQVLPVVSIFYSMVPFM